MSNITFIYQPCSGDRAFAEKAPEDRSILVLRWNNGCRHVAGGYRLCVRSGGSREQRHRWVEILTGLIEAHGGIGWDEQGAISVILTDKGVMGLLDLCAMLETAGHLIGVGLEVERLLPQLLIQGGARLVPRDGGDMAIIPDLHPGSRREIRGAERDTRHVLDGESDGEDPPEEVIRVRLTTGEVITAPAAWGDLDMLARVALHARRDALARRVAGLIAGVKLVSDLEHARLHLADIFGVGNVGVTQGEAPALWVVLDEDDDITVTLHPWRECRWHASRDAWDLVARAIAIAAGEMEVRDALYVPHLRDALARQGVLPA